MFFFPLACAYFWGGKSPHASGGYRTTCKPLSLMKYQLLNAGDSVFKELNSLRFTDDWESLESLVAVVSHFL